MLRIILLSIFISLLTPSVKSQCNHPDYAGLMALYNNTDGPNWVNNTGWKEGAAGTNCNPCNGWRGIKCNTNNRVIEINLIGNNLNGIIPNPSIPFLSKLHLFSNELHGSIPDFTKVPNLEDLNLQNNKLSGNIPNFINLPKLKFLSLSSNQITGTLPNFSNLSNLQVLSCSENQISGVIFNFTNLPNLTNLDCSFNPLYALEN